MLAHVSTGRDVALALLLIALILGAVVVGARCAKESEPSPVEVPTGLPQPS